MEVRLGIRVDAMACDQVQNLFESLGILEEDPRKAGLPDSESWHHGLVKEALDLVQVSLRAYYAEEFQSTADPLRSNTERAQYQVVTYPYNQVKAVLSSTHPLIYCLRENYAVVNKVVVGIQRLLRDIKSDTEFKSYLDDQGFVDFLDSVVKRQPTGVPLRQTPTGGSTLFDVDHVINLHGELSPYLRSRFVEILGPIATAWGRDGILDDTSEYGISGKFPQFLDTVLEQYSPISTLPWTWGYGQADAKSDNYVMFDAKLKSYLKKEFAQFLSKTIYDSGSGAHDSEGKLGEYIKQEFTSLVDEAFDRFIDQGNSLPSERATMYPLVGSPLQEDPESDLGGLGSGTQVSQVSSAAVIIPSKSTSRANTSTATGKLVGQLASFSSRLYDEVVLAVLHTGNSDMIRLFNEDSIDSIYELDDFADGEVVELRLSFTQGDASTYDIGGLITSGWDRVRSMSPFWSV
ncbi:hypothetical protein IWQ60_001715 [Tieghemiomyces parasiticus]|uniref:Uncharacterized protein n=1 Tax=Tieghemiomyces parasiticus TaxID=78921 RepID=A0A9W8AIT2_9FUNG|nr:hypothetical protein IWQ60_001715 [Tieghemiomyces parasiticus]